MTAPLLTLRVATGCLTVALLAACASEPNPATPAATPVMGDRAAASSAAAAVAKLAKNLTGEQVRALLGPPVATKPISAGGVNGETWSYSFHAGTETRLIPVTTQDVPAVDPLSGQATTRAEAVYQNQDVEMIDTLSLLLVDDRLIEWRIVRGEKRRFQ